MYKRYVHDINIAIESILANKLKSILTALGIIFGVAAVISMLAIGKGAQKEILDQIKMVGVNNILINPIFEEPNDQQTQDESTGNAQKRKFSPGLTLSDVDAIKSVLPSVSKISPEISLNSFVQYEGVRVPAKIMGVSNDYFELYNLPLEEGVFFNDYQEDHGIPVCIIGGNIKTKFFSKVDPIDQYIKFGQIWLKVIGYLKKSELSVTGMENTGVNVYNDNVYVPARSMLLRYQNRALVNSKKFTEGNVFFGGGMMISFGGSTQSQAQKNYHQLDRIVVQVKETQDINSTTEVLSRMMIRRHENVKDFEITVPELLLKQQERTKDIFNIVLGAIASISLIVGGIGIMNIMFASVMERIKEIGTRLAIGAKKADIIAQFLSEAVLISVTGGFIGIILGFVLTKLITHFAGILTIISPLSVLVAFGVSAAVGVIFGLSPAKRAAEKDPIESLRYE